MPPLRRSSQRRAMVLFGSAGGPETLRLEEVPDPQPGPGGLLVRVRAAAINYPDVLIIEDKYQLKPARPFAPGGEIAGEIIAIGEGVAAVPVGRGGAEHAGRVEFGVDPA